MIADIIGLEVSRIVITGLRVSPGPSPSGGSLMLNPGVSQNMIDVEGWRHIPGDCPSS